MSTRILVSFTLTGNGVDPCEITSLLGVTPSKTWKQGEKRVQNSSLSWQHDGWRISTKDEESLDLENGVRSIVKKLGPDLGKIREICAQLKLSAEIGCVIHIENEEVPALHLSAEIIKKASELNAEIDIDLYL